MGLELPDSETGAAAFPIGFYEILQESSYGLSCAGVIGLPGLAEIIEISLGFVSEDEGS